MSSINDLLAGQDRCIFCKSKLTALPSNMTLGKKSLKIINAARPAKLDLTLSTVNDSFRTKLSGKIHFELTFGCRNKRHSNKIHLTMSLDFATQKIIETSIMNKIYELNVGRSHYLISITLNEAGILETLLEKNHENIIVPREIVPTCKEDLVRNVDRLMLMKSGLQL
jgi:hypothetical protein